MGRGGRDRGCARAGRGGRGQGAPVHGQGDTGAAGGRDVVVPVTVSEDMLVMRHVSRSCSPPPDQVGILLGSH